MFLADEVALTMGVDIAVYRMRIGTFAGRGRPKARRVSQYTAETSWDEWTDLSVRMVVCTLFLLSLYAYGMLWKSVLMSNCMSSLRMAMMGDHVCGGLVTRVSTATAETYDYDQSSLLMLAGDVELNPGPVGKEQLDSALSAQSESLFQRLSEEMASQLGKVREDINKISDRLENVEKDISHIRNKVEAHEGWMEHISDTTHDLRRRMEEIERHVEDQEARSRRDNVLLYGVPEVEHETPEQSEDKFLEVVNAVLPKPLQSSDIVRAHRVGRHSDGRHRPLIARLAKSSNKHLILQKRQELRQKNFGVSSDLTVNQRAQIQQAKAEGKHAYFKGGVLYTEDRHSQPDPNRPLTRSFARALSQPDG